MTSERREQARLGAIEIGGTKLQLALGSVAEGVVARRRLAIDRAGGAAVIRAAIAEEWPKLTAGGPVEGVGVGFGGPVDWRSGTVWCSHHVGGWSGFALGSWLESVTGCPVVVDNDANVAGLGEASRGAGCGCEPVLYVTLGSGVGAGVVSGGRIYHGALPGEVELGHVRLDRQGTTVESRCSGWAMDGRVRAGVSAEPGSRLGRLVADSPGGEARHLGPALAEGCPLAGRLLDEWAEDFAFGLSHAVHLVHPAVVVLGGGLSLVGEPLRRRVEERLSGFLMDAFRPGPPVALAALGEDAVPAGALLLAAGRWGVSGQ